MDSDHPERQDANDAGFEAGEAGRDRLLNPYPIGTAQFHDWDKGFVAGVYSLQQFQRGLQ